MSICFFGDYAARVAWNEVQLIQSAQLNFDEAVLALDLLRDGYCMSALVSTRILTRVYKVRHIESGEVMALKISEYCGLESIIQSEMRVLQTTYQLPEVPKVRGNGLWRERHYILLNWMQGISVEQHISNGTWRRNLRSCLKMVRNLAHVVVQLHQLDIAHRDVSPEHILCSPQGSVSLIDFGMSRHSGEVPRASFVRYARYDILAVGLVLVEVLVGELLFAYRQPTIAMQVVPAIERLQEVGVPERVLTIIENAVGVESEINSGLRCQHPYLSMPELLADLEKYITSLQAEPAKLEVK